MEEKIKNGAIDTVQSAPPAPQTVIRVKRIDEEVIRKADETLKKYKKGKTNLESRVVEDEAWWKMESDKTKGTSDDIQPSSAWLFNCIISKHADAMDSYPEPNILPRESNDIEEARRLSQILPVVLKYNRFINVYSQVWWQKIKSGTGVYGVFWDQDKLNGLGDISLSRIDILNLFWEPGTTDIQDSKNLFYVSLEDIETLESMYPQLAGKLNPGSETIKEYVYEDNIDTSDKALVVDWYYKVYDPSRKKTILHFVKYCNEQILFASEDADGYENGLYDHGKYPFVLDAMFPQEGSPAGFGYVDVCKNPQKYIDQLDQAILTNAISGATRRWFVREDAQVNTAEYLDFSNPIVRVSGNLSPDSIIEIPNNGLPAIYYQVLQGKIDEMKETSGNRDVNNGGTVSGVTAASAIAAMQEQSGKLSRDMIKASYECFERIVDLCIELIRQFYSTSRQFRIIGENGKEDYVDYSNAGIVPQPQEIGLDGQMGYRLPVFDIDVVAQKENLYTKTSYNEFALQLYQNGFFNADMAPQALAALDIMDFKGVADVKTKIAQNYQVQQQLAYWQQLALTLAAKYEPQMAEGLASGITGMPQAQAPNMGAAQADIKNVEKKEDSRVSNARQAAQERTKPR